MWQAAGRHIQSFFQDGLQSWLKVEPHPPFLEHLSFRIGNQVFFVRLEDVENRAEIPGNRDGLLSVAEGWKGFPCLMPMRRTLTGWKPELGGWGLIDLRNAQSVDPFSLVSDELIEVTDWELLDFAVQVVKQWLQGKGFEIMSTHSNPKVDPNIWFVGDNGPEWVIVRAARYPETVAPPASLRPALRRSAGRGAWASLGLSARRRVSVSGMWGPFHLGLCETASKGPQKCLEPPRTGGTIRNDPRAKSLGFLRVL